ncbi:hypothetical protein [Streptomyces sp. NPDC046942]|uniref:hypothetical protein n=1 Tax=Streptomyces sp. NPDC046942 TaxID=3155137 RepID=UPI0033E0232A
MHYANTPSWRFTQGTSQMLHAALFIRDAATLPVPATAPVPPPLINHPEPVDVPHPLDREVLAAQWLEWWSKLVNCEMSEDRPSQGESSDDTALRMDRILQQRKTVFDPPDFDSLRATPQLQALVRQNFRESLLWTKEVKPRKPPGSSPGASAFPRSLVKNVAEKVAMTHDVPIADVTGAVQVLRVEGIWSQPTAPGRMLCSTAAAAHPDFATALLRDTFVSGLGT